MDGLSTLLSLQAPPSDLWNAFLGMKNSSHFSPRQKAGKLAQSGSRIFFGTFVAYEREYVPVLEGIYDK